MTIEQLGSIGELIGAVATVATLLYLAIQIRANTRMMSAQSDNSRLQLASAIGIALAQEQQLAGVFRRGLGSFESLEPDEQTQFLFAMGQLTAPIFQAHTDLARGVNDQASFDLTWGGTRHLLTSPGGQAYWRFMKNRGAYTPEFVAFLDHELSVSGFGQSSSDTPPAAQQGAAADSA